MVILPDEVSDAALSRLIEDGWLACASSKLAAAYLDGDLERRPLDT